MRSFEEELREEKAIPRDYGSFRTAVKEIVRSEDVLCKAKARYTQELLTREEELDLKTRAVLRYCVHDRANRMATSAEVTVHHDPEVVFGHLAAFEQAVGDSTQLVLLPRTRTSDSLPTQLLHGEVKYQKNEYDFWEVTVEDSPPIHLGNICNAIWGAKELLKAQERGVNLEKIPLVGFDTVALFIELIRQNVSTKPRNLDDLIKVAVSLEQRGLRLDDFVLGGVTLAEVLQATT